MANVNRVCLATSGPLTSDGIRRLPRLLDELGPIHAPSRRMAGRIAASLHAGHAVSDWKSAAACHVILFHGRPALIRRMAAHIAALDGILWRRLTAAVLDSDCDSSELGVLAEHGAATASLHSLPGPQSRWFLLEGSAPAVRTLRRYIEKSHARAIVSGTEQVRLALAAVRLAALPVQALADAALTCLRAAGVPPAQARPAVEQLLTTHVRNSLRLRRKAGPGACAGQNGMDLNELRVLVPGVAALADACGPALCRYLRELAASR